MDSVGTIMKGEFEITLTNEDSNLGQAVVEPRLEPRTSPKRKTTNSVENYDTLRNQASQYGLEVSCLIPGREIMIFLNTWFKMALGTHPGS
jgi:hypothetical protein